MDAELVMDEVWLSRDFRERGKRMGGGVEVADVLWWKVEDFGNAVRGLT